MFNASVTYSKGSGLTFSNNEGTFTGLFDSENLLILLAAFDRDEVQVHGKVLPLEPIEFVVEWVSIDGDELDLDDAIGITRYLKLKFNPEIIGGLREAISHSTNAAKQKAEKVTTAQDI